MRLRNFQEVWKGSSKNHGQFNVTMDNGDITYYTYEASGPTDVKSPASNKWNISGGTGKRKDMKGSGVCSGTRHDDGSSDSSAPGSVVTHTLRLSKTVRLGQCDRSRTPAISTEI